MACYACGSPDGNEARLCAACNLKRIEEQSARVEQLAPRLADIESAQLTNQQKILAGIGSALLAFGLWWLLSPKSPPPPPAKPVEISMIDKAYFRCQQLRTGSTSAANLAAPDTDTLAYLKELPDCDVIVSECRKAPTGEVCTAAAKGL